MIEAIRSWAERNRADLSRLGFSVHLSEPAGGPGKSSVHADLRVGSSEATVQVWDSGEADFHLLASRDANEVVVTHHEFRRPAELEDAMDRLVESMSRSCGT